MGISNGIQILEVILPSLKTPKSLKWPGLTPVLLYQNCYWRTPPGRTSGLNTRNRHKHQELIHLDWICFFDWIYTSDIQETDGVWSCQFYVQQFLNWGSLVQTQSYSMATWLLAGRLRRPWSTQRPGYLNGTFASNLTVFHYPTLFTSTLNLSCRIWQSL